MNCWILQFFFTNYLSQKVEISLNLFSGGGGGEYKQAHTSYIYFSNNFSYNNLYIPRSGKSRVETSHLKPEEGKTMVIELIVWKGQGRVRGSHRISARGGKLTKIQEIGTKTPRAKRVSIANEAHKKKFPPPPEQFSPPPPPIFFSFKW